MRPLVQEPMNTRSMGTSSSWVPALRFMYSRARSNDLRSSSLAAVGGVGDGGRDGRDHAGAGAPTDVGNQRGGIDDQFAIELCARIGGQLAPFRNRLVPGCALGRESAALQIGEGCFVGSDHAGARARLDAHVADGHAAFHRERANGRAGVLDDAAGCAVGADLPDDGEDDVFGGDAGGQLALDGDAERLRGRTAAASAWRARARLRWCRCRTRARRRRRGWRYASRRKRWSCRAW